MKILFRLCFFIFLPIILIVGLTLIFTGVDARGMVLAIGVPGIVVGYFIVWFLAPDKKNTQTNQNGQSEQKESLIDDINESNDSIIEEPSEKERELAALNEINSSKFHTSQIKLAEYEAHHVKEAMKYTSSKGIALGIIFFLFLIADVVLATIFVIKQIFVGGIVCAAIFGIAIITILIRAFIRERISLNGNISKAKKILCGEVKTCFMSSTGSIRSGSTVRVKSVVYRVVVIAEGSEYEAYSRQYYETGAPVIIGVMIRKLAKIVDENDVENQEN